MSLDGELLRMVYFLLCGWRIEGGGLTVERVRVEEDGAELLAGGELDDVTVSATLAGTAEGAIKVHGCGRSVEMDILR